MLAIESYLKLWKVSDKYFVMNISATAALYSKMYSFGMTFVIWSFYIYNFRYMLIQTVRLIVYFISIPDEELCSETAVGCTASYFVKII